MKGWSCSEDPLLREFTRMVTLNVPSSVEPTLRRAFGDDLDCAAREALATEGYRSARLTAGEVAKLVGLETSIQGQQWLAQRGIPLNYSLEDLEIDRASLGKSFPEMARG
jgi:predicted HTH domain antitoxin